MDASPTEESRAVLFAYGIADESVQVANLLKGGAVVAAMDRLIPLLDALASFFVHVRQAISGLRVCNPQLSRACSQYEQRLDALLERIEQTLVGGDLVGLALALEHGVAKALRDYAYFDGPVSDVLLGAPAHLAA